MMVGRRLQQLYESCIQQQSREVHLCLSHCARCPTHDLLSPSAQGWRMNGFKRCLLHRLPHTELKAPALVALLP
jgi:hypothetical protein